ncbi:thiosulfate oxidation carrier complex protein SoxZ [uncultured Ferrovibrio sp.]|jgi:sulfur-oxidizing protein SoxZ|uniref:thiosulfate oxidation carrier complex protein SoxZ n=1 Tax=uncultured Ferrovibrio sp. TaxID=1576913 RepID=UPI002604372A|nr:thiosulfate oxidation carrier complex protein SoxZ [uncultured Ferrovibrio sp.]
MNLARLSFPKTAKKGEIIEIRTLISHVMETGYRPDATGKVVPRDIIRRFTCHYDGEEVFRADLWQAIAANPYLSFTTVATKSGELTFTWEGDNGFRHVESGTITVT